MSWCASSGCPDSSGQILLSDDGLSIDARHVGYTVSPHEECAVELAIQIAKATDGEATVLTLGSSDAIEQVRDAIAVGCTGAVLIEADADKFGPADVAAAIADVVRAREADGTTYDLVLLGNDAADTGDFQVPVRLGYALGRPVLTGISTVDVSDGVATATWRKGSEWHRGVRAAAARGHRGDGGRGRSRAIRRSLAG